MRQHRNAVRRGVLECRRALHVDVDLESKRSKTELYGTRGREDAGAKAETDDGGVIAQKRPRRVACWASGLSALDTTAVISSLLFSHLHPTTGTPMASPAQQLPPGWAAEWLVYTLALPFFVKY